jgi:hypothetical protein
MAAGNIELIELDMGLLDAAWVRRRADRHVPAEAQHDLLMWRRARAVWVPAAPCADRRSRREVPMITNQRENV